MFVGVFFVPRKNDARIHSGTMYLTVVIDVVVIVSAASPACATFSEKFVWCVCAYVLSMSGVCLSAVSKKQSAKKEESTRYE